MVSLITLTGLLAIGAVTLYNVQSELQASGQVRFEQAALYAAESGTAAGMDFLRTSCSTTSLFSSFVEPGNVNPQSPAAILGNGKLPGQIGNLYDPDSDTWYEVSILNNLGDAGLAAGDDTDGIVLLRATGHGPNATVTTIELEVQNTSCVATFCDQEFSQGFMSASNSARSACGTALDPGAGTRVLNPGGP